MEDSEPLSPGTMPSGSQDEDTDSPVARTHSAKQHRAKVGRRLAGRPSKNASNTSLNSLLSQSNRDVSRLDLNTVEEDQTAGSQEDNEESEAYGSRLAYERLVTQIQVWLKAERERQTTRKASRAARKDEKELRREGQSSTQHFKGDLTEDDPADSEALEKLEQILSQDRRTQDKRTRSRSSHGRRKHPHRLRRHLSNARKLFRHGSVGGSSDTDYIDGDVLVPGCDAFLDNTKLAYVSGPPAPSEPNQRKRDQLEWTAFKSDVLRLIHTLKIKRWRRVSLDRGNEIEVERLSGALTNAVYVVTPPKDTMDPRSSPAKLLLRIYGPQVEHLIDREVELQILKRLARQNIGPRMLGTFQNGRFEEYFYARTLGPEDLRNAETSMQIAKRMRELHDNIELFAEERRAGPSVWLNWDKWVDRCEHVITTIDRYVNSCSDQRQDSYGSRGLVCGVDWSTFRKAVDGYRKWLDNQYGGARALQDFLVFAHNDTQYGNILRLEPSGTSPLLLPANAHKRLVVIDFEYASANLPGIEFANHFTEWCYNYHATDRPFALNQHSYPSIEEQRRFIRTYVKHHSQHPTDSSSTPLLSPTDTGLSSSISSFVLESRHGPAQASADEEVDDAVEAEVERLLVDTKLWRVANSAQWVAWGIVQAKVEDLDELEKATTGSSSAGAAEVPETQLRKQSGTSASAGAADHKLSEPTDAEAGDETTTERHSIDTEKGEDEEFDYLSYAQERALFFWGDMVKLGLVSEEELPKEMIPHLKVIDR